MQQFLHVLHVQNAKILILFYYPYCDCEDRSVLYSYLVRNLLKLDVVLLDYPNHIATAVCFNENGPSALGPPILSAFGVATGSSFFCVKVGPLASIAIEVSPLNSGTEAGSMKRGR